MKALGLFDSFAQWYKRLRHSKGFGIHSPFAFMLVNEIINCRCRYYGYDDIELYIDSMKGRKQRRLARLLIRLVGRISFKKFIVIGKADDVLIKAVEIADSRVEIERGVEEVLSSSLIYVTELCDADEDLSASMQVDGNVFVFDGLYDSELRKQYEYLVSECRHGVVFEDCDMSIVFVRNHLPFVKYSMMI